MKAKILIAEDEPASRFIFQTLLQDEGYDVVTCENGAECVELAKREKPDVILLDIQMPVMDGYEVLKVLKSNVETKDIPAIIISANADPHNIKKAFDHGATEFLPKPVNIEELLVRVATVLKIKKTDEELKKLRSEFTYLLIQDLKNTISVIKGSFELALKDKFGELTEDQKLVLEIAETAINNHIKLLNEYLELSRLELNIDKISKQSVEIGTVLKSVAQKFTNGTTYRDFQISFSEIPQVYINGDERKLKRVIELILESIYNAGGREVEISLLGDNSGVMIKILDKNNKISREEADYLFDRYKQASHQKIPRYKDLGLTISKIIVEAHNGKIWAVPNEPSGTSFFIKLPKT